MEANPYLPPQSDSVPVATAIDPDRKRARIQLRLTLLILSVPWAFNFYCFDVSIVANTRNEYFRVWYTQVARPVNLISAVALWIALFFATLPLLLLLARALRAVFAQHVPWSDWLVPLYRSIRLAPWLAVLGALTWLAWCGGFYIAKSNFYTVSIPAGISGHLCAAVFYLPLLYGWIRLAFGGGRRPQQQP